MRDTRLGSLLFRVMIGAFFALAAPACSVKSVMTVSPGDEDGGETTFPDGGLLDGGLNSRDGARTDLGGTIIDAPGAVIDSPVEAGRCSGAGPAVKKTAGSACGCANECATGACVLGVCCSGASCTKHALGTVCTLPSDCESGFCADGVCCNLACTGACVSCGQAGKMGECGPVAAGLADVHKICRQDAPATCGQSGLCNGQGGCSKFAAGTICKLPSCVAGRNLIPAGACDGSGTCVNGAAVDCSPFTCDSNACRIACVDATQCTAPNTCRSGSCGKRGKGQTCTATDQCQSGFCTDGVCCESACTGKCSFCGFANNRGTCVAVGNGVPDQRAAAGVTDPTRVCVDQGPASCGTNGLCNGARGCQAYPGGTVCKSGKCDATGNTETGAGACNAGKCQVPTARSCAPFVGCNGNRCSTFCDADNQCVSGNVCSGNSCGKRPIGSLCSRDADCGVPGICAQGRCCATACNGTCMACNIDGSLGTCRPVAVGGADPTGTCKSDACTNNCDGSGGCRREAVGTTCAASTCGGNNTLTTWTCGSNGACQMSSAACTGNLVCMTDRCSPPAKKGGGGDCLDNSDCVMNACVNGKCCNMACSGACKQCTVDTSWNCGNVVDGGACGGGMICKAGTCTKKDGGETCTDGIECQSGSCLGSHCCANSCPGDVCKQCAAGDSWQCSSRPNNATCGTGLVCTDGNCGAPPKKPNGDVCAAAGECLSGACVTGNCCATDCQGSCKECTAATTWMCANKTNGTVCAAASICTNGSCGKKANGDACVMNDECQSMACVGGFCCGSACTGTCKQCTAGTSWVCTNLADSLPCGAGMICMNGACGNIPLKANGDSCTAGGDCTSGVCFGGACCADACAGTCKQCTAATNNWHCADQTNGTTCGANMVCKTGTCAKKDPGEACSAGADCLSGACLGNVCCAASCSGACKQCVGPGFACSDMTDGTGCGGSNVCLAGACSPKKNNGDACGGNNECTSGQCVNGNCCNVACAGACQQCTTGTCQNKDNATSCGGSNICLAGVCGPKRSDGDSCAAPGECMSANCVSGICCNSACSGICKQCSTGTCGDKTNGVSCGSNLVCAAGACVAAPKANGDSCTAGGDCGSGFCSSDGKCCSESCSGSCRQCTGANWTCADKAEGLACTGGVCTAGVCAPKAGTGATCSVSNQCASGNCTGGHCCDMACSGSCQQCTAGTSWVCSPTNEGMDCSGNTNFCKMGACVPKKAPGDACGAGNECASGNCLASGFCCGSATCTDVCKECTAGTSWTCDKKSNGTTCNGSDVCQEGACKKDKGGSCGGDTDCAVGACVGGHCCTTACVGECKECTVTTGWACMPKTVGTVCGSGMMCTADGMCM